MAKLSQIKADAEKMKNGVWVNYSEDIKLCIASINSPEYKKARKEALEPHQRRIRSGDITQDQVLNIIKPAIAKHVLVGWKNIQDDNGKTIDYSHEKALGFFNDPEMFDFLNFVLEAASEKAAYKRDFVEESVKN